MRASWPRPLDGSLAVHGRVGYTWDGGEGVPRETDRGGGPQRMTRGEGRPRGETCRGDLTAPGAAGVVGGPRGLIHRRGRWHPAGPIRPQPGDGTARREMGPGACDAPDHRAAGGDTAPELPARWLMERPPDPQLPADELVKWPQGPRRSPGTCRQQPPAAPRWPRGACGRGGGCQATGGGRPRGGWPRWCDCACAGLTDLVDDLVGGRGHVMRPVPDRGTRWGAGSGLRGGRGGGAQGNPGGRATLPRA